MRTYEVVFIVNPELDETALAALVEKVKSWITDANGAVEKVEMWGKRRMTYIIRKQREGQYVFLQAQMAPTYLAELDRNMRFLEPVMRYLITAA
jgi:small subunit ribosomal protein S6